MKPLCAIILAAGKGTRFKSELAKVLHPILGRPMLGYVLEAARGLGADRLVVVVGHQAESVRAAFDGSDLEFVVQDPQLGTGHAVMQAAGTLRGFQGDVIILMGDTPLLTTDVLRPLLDDHREAGAALTLMSMVPEDPFGYGRVVRDEAGFFEKIVEERDADDHYKRIGEVNAGFYVSDAPLLFTALDSIRPDNDQAEFYLTDVPAVLLEQGHQVAIHCTERPEDLAGINDRAQLAAATSEIGRRINVGHMIAGVTLEHPETTFIESSVQIGRDVIIEAGVHLKGRTVIKSGTRVGVGAIVIDSILAEGIEVRPYSILEGSDVEAGAVIGPFARLRPGTKVGAKALVGNFVETKQTTIGAETFAAHLSFLGDTDIGPDSNIGAGTITANWDGAATHRTVIEAGAKIGANATLIAPVKIGAGATVGGGSTITEDVPPKSTAIGRGRQVNKEGN
jgi:bifunctional UDP-N-acetylglucosamine pyrophosphorylase/glucosamine-1-phosphate N-acetyltransferase